MSSSIPSHSIDRTSFVPFYIQVIEALSDYIEVNKLPPGYQLPGEVELCRTFNVSRTVIRQALRELEHKGLIYREKGRGTFVSKPKIHESLLQELTGFYQDMVAKGHKPRSDVLLQEKIVASSTMAGYLDLEPGSFVIQIDRLRYVNSEPVVFVTTYLPYDLCPELLNVDLSNQSLYSYLENEHGLILDRGRRFLEAVCANEVEAEMLNIDIGSPLLMLDSVSYLPDGTPIEYFHALHRGDRSRFETELVRVSQPSDLAKKIRDTSNP
jgi:GntR family transcriptional regulator